MIVYQYVTYCYIFIVCVYISISLWPHLIKGQMLLVQILCWKPGLFCRVCVFVCVGSRARMPVWGAGLQETALFFDRLTR